MEPSRNHPDSVGLKVLGQLRQLGRTEPRLVGSRGKRPSTEDLQEGRFTIFGKAAHITPPVDWKQDPHNGRSWRYELHTMTWLKPLLLAHAEQRDAASLAVARNILLDWAQAHLERTGEISEFAWYDMAVGLRAPYYAYVLRESLVPHELQDRDVILLLRAAERHGAELASDDNYATGHNHGLFQDEGLYLLATQLPALPDAAKWQKMALRRMRSTLEQTISFKDGAHLEHSSAYQFSITSLVSRLAENIAEMPELRDLRDRMRETAAWHVTPTNRLAQLGDTDDVPAPKWAQQASTKLHGLNALFEAGQAFVRDGDSYLAVSAAYHSPAHKHADDTGFILVENGITVLGDAGKWGYYEDDSDRIYARSAHAHNVLTIGNRDFSWRRTVPYGSGLMAAHADNDFFIIFAQNPLLAADGVTHQRLFMYRPRRTLIIVDKVNSHDDHCYARNFHFGTSLDARVRGSRSVVLSGNKFTATLIDLSQQVDIKLQQGTEGPVRSGWAYLADRERIPVWTATFRSHASTTSLITVLLLH